MPSREFSCGSANGYPKTLDDPLQFLKRVILNRDGSLGLGPDHANPCSKKSLKLLLDLDQLGNGASLGPAALVPRGPAGLRQLFDVADGESLLGDARRQRDHLRRRSR